MSNGYLNRRRILQLASAGVVGATGVLTSATAAADDPDASITFESQTSDGSSITVAEASSSVDGFIVPRSDETGSLARVDIDAGETRTDFDIQFDEPVTDSDELDIAVSIYEAETGQGIAREVSTVVFSDTVDVVSGRSTTLIESDPDAGFNYPYYLYAPDRTVAEDSDAPPILVEPNNTGATDDDLDVHRDRAESTIEGGVSRSLSERLGVPLLVPVFPRPQTDPVDWTHYTHALDVETLTIDGGKLERIDLQLLAMVDHARAQLEDDGYETSDDLVLNGFSASGNFVDRFTVLHPDRVLSVTAGGLNGMALLPLEEYDGRRLPFHVGIADVEEHTGEPVDLEALDDVNQLLYMGGEDDNDTIPYDDAWTDDELRQTALDVYGDDMIAERFPTCQEAYEKAGVDAQFKIYEDAGHSPGVARDDIVEFHERSIAGEDVGEFGEKIGATVTFEATPEPAAAGEPVEFDASDSQAVTGDIVAYTWDFDDGGTAAGETVSHTFEDPGEYTVTLTIVDDNGTTEGGEFEVAVESGDGERETDVEGEDGDSADERETAVESEEDFSEEGETNETADDGSSDGTPGPGIGGALASIAGAGYLLRRRHGDRNDRSRP